MPWPATANTYASWRLDTTSLQHFALTKGLFIPASLCLAHPTTYGVAEIYKIELTQARWSPFLFLLREVCQNCTLLIETISSDNEKHPQTISKLEDSALTLSLLCDLKIDDYTREIYIVPTMSDHQGHSLLPNCYCVIVGAEQYKQRAHFSKISNFFLNNRARIMYTLDRI